MFLKAKHKAEQDELKAFWKAVEDESKEVVICFGVSIELCAGNA